jgi:hypothetical protein
VDEIEKVPEIVGHVISAEDREMNPELATEGVAVGDVIGLPISDEPLTEEQKAEIIAQHPDLADKLEKPEAGE